MFLPQADLKVKNQRVIGFAAVCLFSWKVTFPFLLFATRLLTIIDQHMRNGNAIIKLDK